MSHQDYIAKLNEDQLDYLIELASEKLRAIRDEGFIKMWNVHDNHLTYKWFRLGDYSSALDFLYNSGQGFIAFGTQRELKITKESVRPSEVEQLLEM